MTWHFDDQPTVDGQYLCAISDTYLGTDSVYPRRWCDGRWHLIRFEVVRAWAPLPDFPVAELSASQALFARE